MPSSIKDNRTRGKVGDFLKDCLKDGSRLSFVSAYFTIYAYEKLKDQLQKIDHLNFSSASHALSKVSIPIEPTRRPSRSRMKNWPSVKGGAGDGGLLSGRDGRLMGKAKQVEGAEDFELISWLVIKEANA